MTARYISTWSVSAIALTLLVGCATGLSVPTADLANMMAEVEVVGPAESEVIADVGRQGSLSPFSIRGSESPQWKPPESWELTIDEAIQIALANSTVLRSLGARVIQTPGLTPTIYGPAIQATNPTAGIEAALSEFDARLNGNIYYEDNDRVLNNEFVGGGVNFFHQDLTRMESSLSKRAATGTLFTLRQNFDADLNNSDRNLLPGRAWDWNFEGEISQPLLQGRGVMFNRIAGPNATPGVYNGVIIARLNADITVAQLEIALRNFLSDVENAYWDLHFAYADLQIKTKARDRSLNTYRLLQARSELPGAEKDKLAQAKEQYFRFEEDVQNALAGRLLFGTRAFNGSGGGTFQGTGGVYVAERRLRMIMGVPINDGRLIRTASEPTDVPVTFDWNDLVSNALARRTELRSQRLLVDKREFELVASRNFLLPRLDAVGRYRYRGLGEGLFDRNIPLNNAAVGSDTHEWLMGLSLSYPVGFRQAFSAVRNAQLELARERAMLTELERQVVYGLSNAISETDRAYSVLRVAISRTNAAEEQYEILNGEAQAPVRQFDFNALLDAEQRFAEAATAANRARVQYALATKNLNFEMGALLEYFNIHLTEDQGLLATTTAQSTETTIGNVVSQITSPLEKFSPDHRSGPASQFDADDPEQSATETGAAESTMIGEDLINEIIERELAAGETIVSRSESDPPIASPSDR
ncbi:TolC family protein [Stieleria sp. TO1_6]|uniref:TolC family protein n=1 Tax=Stieleria tagensis TaxID=2956795 RepID=UPI00209AB0E3|nr:TolC family protein [Stieleria tagensis]MCO8120402.1 TolC family protein [Stieleria tagensis]